ncbi:MAG: hypothetical protein J0L92_27075 [Deltaproteobacteria bacterium]|nr:hypothetical protein [Deltaproteobacteria bacterium]
MIDAGAARVGALGLMLGLLWMTGCMCPQGQLSCDGQCIDPSASALHCGACGVSCGPTARCEEARCVALPECGPRSPSPRACDDADLCNGVFECLDGRCQQTVPPVSCDDGVSCTHSYCEPSEGRCHHDIDDSSCEEGSFCHPDDDCTVRCLRSPCSVISQCGCAEDDTCTPTTSGDPSCVLPGTGGAGLACSLTTQCAPGLVCIDAGDIDRARCATACGSNADCGGDLRCFASLGFSSVLTTGERFGRCEDSCDPVDASGCPAARGCVMVPLAGGRSAVTVCGDGGSGAAGADCFDASCALGHTCVAFSDRDACARLCHDDRDCPGTPTCRRFAVDLVVHGEPVGYCG